jgi:hypothetical protein
MNSTPESVDSGADAEGEAPALVADDRLLAAHDLALSALREITPAATIGEPAGYTLEADGVVSLRFATTMEGYPGWFWTVSLAVVDDAEPTVLEAELLPGEGALLAPEWVPWAVRLAEYQAAQAALAAERGVEAEDAEASTTMSPTRNSTTTTSTTWMIWMPPTSTTTDRRSCTPVTSTASTSTCWTTIPTRTRTRTRTTRTSGVSSVPGRSLNDRASEHDVEPCALQDLVAR